MNLYLISQNENGDYDTFDSAVVAAPNEEIAKNIHPADGTIIDWNQNISKEKSRTTWAWNREAIIVCFLGIAEQNIQQGIICSSYNSG